MTAVPPQLIPPTGWEKSSYQVRDVCRYLISITGETVSPTVSSASAHGSIQTSLLLSCFHRTQLSLNFRETYYSQSMLFLFS